MLNIKAIRDRGWHYLNPAVAADVGMTLAQLQQFVGGTFTPTPEQLEQLARRIGVQR